MYNCLCNLCRKSPTRLERRGCVEQCLHMSQHVVEPARKHTKAQRTCIPPNLDGLSSSCSLLVVIVWTQEHGTMRCDTVRGQVAQQPRYTPYELRLRVYESAKSCLTSRCQGNGEIAHASRRQRRSTRCVALPRTRVRWLMRDTIQCAQVGEWPTCEAVQCSSAWHDGSPLRQHEGGKRTALHW